MNRNEEIWSELIELLHVGKIIPTFKGKENFRISTSSQDEIVVSLFSKDKQVVLSKKSMMNAIDKLVQHKEGVRQKMVDPEARIKLGLLQLIPSTEKVKRYEDGKNRAYLLLNS